MKLSTTFATLALALGLSAAADCTRQVKCLTNYDPVCGSNGQTYSNLCVFNNAACQAATLMMPKLTQLFKGACDMDPNPFCALKCTKDLKPVCGTDGKTYDNRCVLQSVKCKDITICVAHEGKCKPPPKKCNDVCPMIYNPVCGSDGVTYGNPCMLGVAACKKPKLRLKAKHTGECVETSETCVKGCPKIFLPACGSNGITYNSKCELTNAACVDKTVTWSHDGECKDAATSAPACAATTCAQYRECKVDEATGRPYCADICDPKRCAADQVCSLMQVQCLTTPCPPQATCTTRVQV